MGGYGTYSGGTTPTLTSAAWSGCSTSAATGVNIYDMPYGTVGGRRTYMVVADPPTASGSCTLNVVTNLGSVSSPAAQVDGPAFNAAVTLNVHNAPGWLHNHPYTVGAGPKTRVVNGAGWNEGASAWVPGSALNAYELISGACTSANTIGAGPTGTGSSISDGGCTWKYLSPVDYITLSGALNDGPPWVSGTTYTFGNYVTTNVGGVLRAYKLDQDSAQAPVNTTTGFCTSTVAPSGTGTGPGFPFNLSPLAPLADGCQWIYLSDVIYSSQRAPIPVVSWVNECCVSPGQSGRFKVNYHGPYTIDLWNDAEYLAGASNGFGNEAQTFRLWFHWGADGYEIGGLSNQCPFTPGYCPSITIEAAPPGTTTAGESFAVNYTTSTPMAGYDATKGVAIRSTVNIGSYWNDISAGFTSWDQGAIYKGLQFKSQYGIGLNGFNAQIVLGNLVDGGNGSIGGGVTNGAALWVDAGNVIFNNIIISRSTIGFNCKYECVTGYNTIINAGSVSDAVATMWGNNQYGDMYIYNTAAYGFGHFTGHISGGGIPFVLHDGNNFTDVVGPDSGFTTYWSGNVTPTSSITVNSPNTSYGTSGASMFQNPASDYRPNTALIGGGAAFGTVNWSCTGFHVVGPPCPVGPYDTPDAIGTARPQSSQYDAGALEH